MRFGILAAAAALGMSAPVEAFTTIDVSVAYGSGVGGYTIDALTPVQFAALDHVEVVSTFRSASGSNFAATSYGGPGTVRITTMGAFFDSFFNSGGSAYIDYDLPVAGQSSGFLASPSLSDVKRLTLTGTSLSIFQNAISYVGGAPVYSTCQFIVGVGPCNEFPSRPSGNVRSIITYYFNGPVPGSVPEPSTWAMMIGGFALAGATMRRRYPALT